jgi:hypothetical protein
MYRQKILKTISPSHKGNGASGKLMNALEVQQCTREGESCGSLVTGKL